MWHILKQVWFNATRLMRFSDYAMSCDQSTPIIQSQFNYHSHSSPYRDCPSVRPSVRRSIFSLRILCHTYFAAPYCCVKRDFGSRAPLSVYYCVIMRASGSTMRTVRSEWERSKFAPHPSRTPKPIRVPFQIYHIVDPGSR